LGKPKKGEGEAEVEYIEQEQREVWRSTSMK
jgi:hypothetical protein